LLNATSSLASTKRDDYGWFLRCMSLQIFELRVGELKSYWGPIFNDSGLKTRPSELFRRNCWISFEPVEGSLRVLADYVGPNKVMWAIPAALRAAAQLLDVRAWPQPDVERIERPLAFAGLAAA
jgi:hypothetical protein